MGVVTGRRWASALACTALLAVGCSSDAGPAQSSDDLAAAREAQAQAGEGLQALSGTWTGEWQSTSPVAGSGSIRLVWQQFGRAMRGTVTISGDQCLDGGAVLGRINGNEVDFDIESGEAEVLYAGQLSGNAMSGTYTTTCANSEGTWQMTKVSAP